MAAEGKQNWGPKVREGHLMKKVLLLSGPKIGGVNGPLADPLSSAGPASSSKPDMH